MPSPLTIYCSLKCCGHSFCFRIIYIIYILPTIALDAMTDCNKKYKKKIVFCGLVCGFDGSWKYYRRLMKRLHGKGKKMFTNILKSNTERVVKYSSLYKEKKKCFKWQEGRDGERKGKFCEPDLQLREMGALCELLLQKQVEFCFWTRPENVGVYKLQYREQRHLP